MKERLGKGRDVGNEDGEKGKRKDKRKSNGKSRNGYLSLSDAGEEKKGAKSSDIEEGKRSKQKHGDDADGSASGSENKRKGESTKGEDNGDAKLVEPSEPVLEASPRHW